MFLFFPTSEIELPSCNLLVRCSYEAEAEHMHKVSKRKRVMWELNAVCRLRKKITSLYYVWLEWKKQWRKCLYYSNCWGFSSPLIAISVELGVINTSCEWNYNYKNVTIQKSGYLAKSLFLLCGFKNIISKWPWMRLLMVLFSWFFFYFFFFFDTWLCSYQAKAAAELHKKTRLDHMVCIF